MKSYGGQTLGVDTLMMIQWHVTIILISVKNWSKLGVVQRDVVGVYVARTSCRTDLWQGHVAQTQHEHVAWDVWQGRVQAGGTCKRNKIILLTQGLKNLMYQDIFWWHSPSCVCWFLSCNEIFSETLSLQHVTQTSSCWTSWDILWGQNLAEIACGFFVKHVRAIFVVATCHCQTWPINMTQIHVWPPLLSYKNRLWAYASMTLKEMHKWQETPKHSTLMMWHLTWLGPNSELQFFTDAN